MQRNSSNDPSSPSKIYISTGCVLIPAFAIFWYYYTKRVCRKFVVGFLKNEPDNESDTSDRDFVIMEEAYYNQQQQQHQQHRDDVNNHSPTVVTDRFVKWVNRQNVFAGYQEDQLEKRTKENLFGKDHTTTSVAAAAAASARNHRARHANINNSTINKNLMDKNFDRDDSYYDDDDNDDISSLFWECIPSTQHSQFELCATETTLPNDSNNQRNSDASIMSPNSTHNLPVITHVDKYLVV